MQKACEDVVMMFILNEFLQNARHCYTFECYKSYQQSWPFLNDHFKTLDIGPFNIQKYNNGGHFAKIHSERTSLQHLLAFCIYDLFK